MIRKLKVYRSSLGFFDTAVAAPSMKAALEAWGARSNLFHQGLAEETHDPEVVAATLAKPGIVLRRPIGSAQAFREEAGLPTGLVDQPRRKPKQQRKPAKVSHRTIDDRAARKAALTYQREDQKRERKRLRDEEAAAKQRIRQEQAFAKATATYQRAEQDHQRRARRIEADRQAVERRSRTEKARWDKQRQKLQAAIRQVRI